MSLINDALKRAKQAKQEQPPAAAEAPPLRPTEPSYQPSLWPFLVLPLALAVVLALAGIFLWRWIDQAKLQQAQMAKKPELEAKPPAANKIVTSNPKPATAQTTPGPSSSTSAPPASAGGVQPATTNPTPAGTINAISNTTAAVVEPPAPPPLKLQGIFYTRKNPSAVINGKIRRVGDRIGEARLVAIGPESVTVIVGGKTNEMVLP
ncbi:MAG: hypothetical protein HY298_18290 [Verrucomicrobia bacterium]|nr:hypothetical protein [Verrucomicrobiota bacterium]